MNILKRISSHNTTLIGYDTRNDLTIDKIVKLLPSVVTFGRALTVHVNEVLDYFNSLSQQRDYKLASLLNSEEDIFVIIGLNNIYFDEDIQNTHPIDRAKLIKKFIHELQTKLYQFNDEFNIKYRLILLTKLYSSPTLSSSTFRDKITLYSADLVLKMEKNKISIEKDRYMETGGVSNIDYEMRDLLIDQIFSNDSK